MCTPKAPDVPTVPERQAAKLPDRVGTAARSGDTLARRRALMATVLTGPQGTIAAPPTTMAKKLGG